MKLILASGAALLLFVTAGCSSNVDLMGEVFIDGPNGATKQALTSIQLVPEESFVAHIAALLPKAKEQEEALRRSLAKISEDETQAALLRAQAAALGGASAAYMNSTGSYAALPSLNSLGNAVGRSERMSIENQERAKNERQKLSALQSGASTFYFRGNIAGATAYTETGSDGKYKLSIDGSKPHILIATKDDFAWAIKIAPSKTPIQISLSNKNLAGEDCANCVFKSGVTPTTLAAGNAATRPASTQSNPGTAGSANTPTVDDPVAKQQLSYDTLDGWIKQFEERAAGGDSAAMLLLAEFFLRKCTPNNDAQAKAAARSKGFEYASRAADTGDPAAQYLVGYAHASGLGTARSQLKAIEWFSKSAQQNYSAAEVSMCRIYDAGYDVEKNKKKAIEYCQRAAKQDHPEGKAQLIVIKNRDANPGATQAPLAELVSLAREDYYSKFGRGRSDLTRKVFELYKEAAISGQVHAQQFVSNILYLGDGSPKDAVLGYAWAQVANQTPMENFYCSVFGDLSPLAANRLSTRERNEAQALAADWRKGRDIIRASPTR